MPTVTPKPVKTSEKAEEMLRFDLDNENETIRNYRERVRQCEALGEYAMAEHIREILVNEQEHQIDLATALGKDVPDVTKPDQRPELGRGLPVVRPRLDVPGLVEGMFEPPRLPCPAGTSRYPPASIADVVSAGAVATKGSAPRAAGPSVRRPLEFAENTAQEGEDDPRHPEPSTGPAPPGRRDGRPRSASQ